MLAIQQPKNWSSWLFGVIHSHLKELFWAIDTYYSMSQADAAYWRTKDVEGKEMVFWMPSKMPVCRTYCPAQVLRCRIAFRPFELFWWAVSLSESMESKKVKIFHCLIDVGKKLLLGMCHREIAVLDRYENIFNENFSCPGEEKRETGGVYFCCPNPKQLYCATLHSYDRARNHIILVSYQSLNSNFIKLCVKPSSRLGHYQKEMYITTPTNSCR